MKKFFVVFGFFACAVLSSSRGFAGPSYAGRVALKPIPDATACPGGQILPLLAALAPIVVQQGLDFLGKLAAERAASYEATVSATTADQFLINCGTTAEPHMQLHIGGLAFGYGPVSGDASPGLRPEYTTLGFTGIPKIYLEGDFKQDETTGKYIRFVPTRFEFNDKLAQSGNEKDVLVTLTFGFPSAAVQTNEKQASSTGGGDQSKKSQDNSQIDNGGKSTAASKSASKSKTVPATVPATVDDKSLTEKPATEKVDSGSSGNPPTAPAQTVVGGTQSVVLPLFEHMVKGQKINLTAVTTEWILLPTAQHDSKIDNKKNALPVNLNIVVKETDQGHGANVWLAVSDAIAKNSSTIASAILGKSPTATAKPGSSTNSATGSSNTTSQ